MKEISRKIRQIFIVEYLGTHAPTNHYLQNLERVLKLVPDAEVKVLSNYSESPDSSPFFVNQYEGWVWNQVLALYKNYRSLNKLIDQYPDALFIFVAYGNSIDISFIRIMAKAKYHIIDIQDVIAKREADNDKMIYDFAKTYSQWINAVISHSELTDAFLDNIGFCGEVFKLPPMWSEQIDIESLASTAENSKLYGEIETFLHKFSPWLKSDID